MHLFCNTLTSLYWFSFGETELGSAGEQPNKG